MPQLRDINYSGLRVLLYSTVDYTNGKTNKFKCKFSFFEATLISDKGRIQTQRDIQTTQIITENHCKREMPIYWEKTIKISSICTQHIQDTKHYCNNAGAPLMAAYMNPNSQGISYYLIGIRTTGIGVCTDESNYPQINIRISDYLHWIQMYLL